MNEQYLSVRVVSVLRQVPGEDELDPQTLKVKKGDVAYKIGECLHDIMQPNAGLNRGQLALPFLRIYVDDQSPTRAAPAAAPAAPPTTAAPRASPHAAPQRRGAARRRAAPPAARAAARRGGTTATKLWYRRHNLRPQPRRGDDDAGAGVERVDERSGEARISTPAAGAAHRRHRRGGPRDPPRIGHAYGL
eukprot:gene9599-biopygen2510